MHIYTLQFNGYSVTEAKFASIQRINSSTQLLKGRVKGVKRKGFGFKRVLLHYGLIISTKASSPAQATAASLPAQPAYSLSHLSKTPNVSKITDALTFCCLCVLPGLESGFVTLPRLSRSERQQPSISMPTSFSPNIHRGSLTDPADAILATRASSPDTKPTTTAYSDSLPSLTSLDTFTFDLGPSLMSEVFSLIDEHGLAWEGEEVGSACGMTNEGSEMDSATISYVDSLLREDCGSGRSPQAAEWGEGEEEGEEEEDERSGVTEVPGKVSDLALGSAERVRMGMGMESERFRSATDVLARHYGGSCSKGHSRMEAVKKGVSYSYMDEEDEIKV